MLMDLESVHLQLQAKCCKLNLADAMFCNVSMCSSTVTIISRILSFTQLSSHITLSPISDPGGGGGRGLKGLSLGAWLTCSCATHVSLWVHCTGRGQLQDHLPGP